ncbi:hypothetical protein [Burkholderia ubonensis]|uniref:hypothetical protein n=1 Tax=Burkholderia ubonensis TaxID=101571 RepID=UPI001E41ED10|nr:hypothetical protein [Burkholderia ubonensis]
MKKAGGYVCAVCGDDQAVESHHRFFERAFSHAIDWKWIRGVALNQFDTMFSHKLQRVVPIPRQHPVWDVQAFLLPDFVYSPDELKQLHAKEPK